MNSPAENITAASSQSVQNQSKKSKILLVVFSFLFIAFSIPLATYLIKQRQEIRPAAEKPEVSINCQSCDVTGDGCFDEADTPKLEDCYGKTASDIDTPELNCSHWDVNHDGKIDVIDLGLCAGQCSCGNVQPTPTPGPDQLSCYHLDGPAQRIGLKAGDNITLTCIGGNENQPISRFHFQVKVGEEQWRFLIPDVNPQKRDDGRWQGTTIFTIPNPAYNCYDFECQACQSFTECSPWSSS